MITYDDFQRLDIRVATIVKVEEIDGADRLLKLTLDAGELGERVIASGIKEYYPEKKLVGRQIIYLANLEQRELKGVVSEGMLLAANDNKPVLLCADEAVTPGSKIS